MALENEINKLKKKVHTLEEKEKKNSNFDRDKVYSDSLKYYERALQESRHIYEESMEETKYIYEKSVSFVRWFMGILLTIIGIVVGYIAYTSYITVDELKKEMQSVKFNSELGLAVNKNTPEEKIVALKNINTDNLSLENRFTLYFQLGYFSDVSKKYKEAITHYNSAIELKKYNERVVNNKIIIDYDEVIQLDKKFAPVYYNRGLIYHNLGDKKKAISDYTESIRSDPNFAKAYYNRGILYCKQGHDEKAISDYTESIRLDPKFLNVYYNRGLLYYKYKKYDKSFSDYSEVIRLDSHYVHAYNNRGKNLIMLKKYQLALNDLVKCMELDKKYKFAIDIFSENYDGFKKYLEEKDKKNDLEKEVLKRLIKKEEFTVKKEDQ